MLTNISWNGFSGLYCLARISTNNCNQKIPVLIRQSRVFRLRDEDDLRGLNSSQQTLIQRKYYPLASCKFALLFCVWLRVNLGIWSGENSSMAALFPADFQWRRKKAGTCRYLWYDIRVFGYVLMAYCGFEGILVSLKEMDLSAAFEALPRRRWYVSRARKWSAKF